MSVGARRFFLMDGDWFEIGADYIRASSDAIGRLFPATPTISLPPWLLTERRTEYDYNCYVAASSKSTKVVYAILMPKGRTLTPDTLFPFSQATLAHAVRILGTYGIEVEVIGIPAA